MIKTNLLTTFQYFTLAFFLFVMNNSNAQIGYYTAPYVRYEADLGNLTNGAAATTKSYNQSLLQSEASEQVCVNMSSANASVDWTVSTAGDGLVVRFSVPDGQTAVLDVLVNNVDVGDLNLNTYYSWEYLSSNGNPNNVGVVNTNPKMRFDEVRLRLPASVPSGGNLKLVRKTSTSTVHIDFAELEPVPAAVGWSAGNVTYTGNGSDLQTFIDNNGGATIYMPAGLYNVNRDLYFGVANTTLKGAGMWYTQIHFTSGAANDGGLWGQAANISYSGLYLTTSRNSRSSSYKAINGVYTGGVTLSNIWAEHFECGAWIAQYGAGPVVADNFTISNCRFRNNYADGTNLCKGTRNAVVEYCNYRNNGDDDMAIWSANGQECQNNTFRYNTSENCWRASGCAIYGGLSNKAYNLLIKDNVEVGIKVNNAFGGAPFNGGGLHEIYNISIIRCGTNQDLFNRPVGAIDLGCYDYGAGLRVQNVKFSCITITDSKNDAIYINKVSGTSDGFYNLVFENITINGTGREYPDNGGTGTARGHMILFKGFPAGNSTYCGMNYSNRGGNATVDVNTTDKGALSWTLAGSCPGGCVPFTTSSTTITSATTFGVCNNPITLTATTIAPSGNTVSYIEFFVDNVSIGQDNSSTYSMAWSNPSIGTHQVHAIAHYSGGGSSTSATQNVVVADGIYTTGTAPTIDGAVDGLWGGYAPFPLNLVSVGSISGAADLTANFKITRDATNLYILVDVTDDVLRNDGAANWEKDAVELFIDMGNDKATSYGANDYQYNFIWNVNTPQAGLTFAQTNKPSNLGYYMEIRIPWTTLGGAPAVGSFIGFDVHVNDDDNGGTRDAKKAWKDGTDNAWQNPSVLGTLQIAGCASPLPVELIKFTGEIIDESVLLTWTTVSERNNEKFIIERSINSIDWVAIGEVVGVGNSNTLADYNFIDPEIINNKVYYRLKQLDVEGVYTYSTVIAIQLDQNNLQVSPNPFENELIILNNHSGRVFISIYDVMGRIVYHSTLENDNGISFIYPDLTSGTYLVTMQTSDSFEQQKILKK